MMKIVKKITVVSEATGGIIVDKYICNKCKKTVETRPRGEIDREIKYSRLIYCICNKCLKK